MEGPTESASKHTELFRLIQPELLPAEELTEILKSRCVTQNLVGLTKQKLVEVFRKVAMPLPQRHYPDTTRGRLLNKIRLKLEKSKCDRTEEEKKTFTICVNGVAGIHNTTKIGDRLKPPPDIINFERKKIRLSSSSNGCEKSDRSKDNVLNKIVINEHKRQSVDSKSDGKSCDSHSDMIKEKPNIKETKKIVLKRNHLSTQAKNSVSTDKEETEEKRKKITWP